jgi:hypothetical protein
MAGTSPLLSPSSRIYDAGICRPAEYAALVRCGINTVGELLEANPDTLPNAVASSGVTPQDLRRWQTCCRLMISIPEMAPGDAQLMFDCGFEGPEDLADVRGELLLRRLSDYLSATGRAGELARFSVERINTWMRSLARTRPNWHRLDRSAGTLAASGSNGLSHWLTPIHGVPIRESAAATRLDARTNEPERDYQAGNEVSSEARRFFLNLNDSVNAAPSIGTKTCEQLNQIGVRTVRDLLNGSPEDISRRLNQRRITAETVSVWQRQARLGVSVPNLRRRDVQILVECGVNHPEGLARMNPDQLWATVQQFFKSKAGLRLVRSGKMPDQQHVQCWIRWAQSHRQLQAA